MLHPGTAWLSRLRPWLPSQCLICQRWPGASLCADCLARWAQPVHRCRLCALALPLPAQVCGQCLRQPPAQALCLAAVDYAYPWQQLLGDFKFRGHTALAWQLSELLRSHPEISALLQREPLLIPVPLSAQALRQRGYDQTALLARALAPRLVLHDAVERQASPLPQHQLTRSQRLRAMRGQFSMRAGALPRLAGQLVVVLDDVVTTGATISALAQCLRQAGAREVAAIVVARTPA